MRTMEQNRRKFERGMRECDPTTRRIILFAYAAFAVWLGAMMAVL